MRVPFNDLYQNYLSIKKDIDEAINDVIKNSLFIRGRHVEEFEINFSKLVGANNCISCANGTDALYIAMKALGIKQGDEVIVPAHSWISTSETITQAGGKVIFCDTGKDFLIDVEKIADKITKKTVGIIPVHLFGQAVKMDKVLELAEKNNLWVIEDCAQAHLATFKGKKVGTFGNAGTFSFYPGKKLGAMGDAGAIVSQNSELSKKMAKFARHGGLQKGEHEMEGINSRMDGIQAAILNIKLKYIKDWTLQRKLIAEKYLSDLSNTNHLRLPLVNQDTEHVWHLFVILHERRDELKDYLSNKKIQTVINYPISLPFLKAYEYMHLKKEDFPISYFHQSRILSLPIFPGMKLDQINYTIDCINKFNN